MTTLHERPFPTLQLKGCQAIGLIELLGEMIRDIIEVGIRVSRRRHTSMARLTSLTRLTRMASLI